MTWTKFISWLRIATIHEVYRMVEKQSAKKRGGANIYGAAGTANVSMHAASIAPTAGPANAQPHENRQPFLALNFVIALQGIFPSQN